MRVGLFNRWVRTAGGGERYSLALAALLARHAEVEVLTPELVDLAAIGDRLHLRLDDLGQRRIGASDLAASRASADYDLFVNASYMSLPWSRARRSVLLVYFPNQIFPSRRALTKARVAERLARHLSFPRFERGFHGPEAAGRRLVRWTDGRSRLRIRVPPGGSTLDLVLAAPADRTPVTVHCSGVGIDTTRELRASRAFAHHRIPLPPSGGGDLEVEILSGTVDLSKRTHGRGERRRGVLLRDVHVSGLRNALYRLVFERLLPSRRYVFEGADPHHAVWRGIGSYDLICTCSEFSRHWIETYWARPAEVFYPPVDVDRLQPGDKAPLILSVGRFFTGGHSKRQDVMLTAVRALAAELPPQWRVVLAGGVGTRTEDRRYFERLRRLAQGLPVDILGDVSGPALTALYRRAAIYWHAAGYRESGTINPAHCEHFGISTVEAMAAGCVPIVYGSGGQAEIVRPGVDGLLWRTIPELLQHTRNLVHDERRRAELRTSAVARAQAFGVPAFEARAAALFGPLLTALGDRPGTSVHAPL